MRQFTTRRERMWMRHSIRILIHWRQGTGGERISTLSPTTEPRSNIARCVDVGLYFCYQTLFFEYENKESYPSTVGIWFTVMELLSLCTIRYSTWPHNSSSQRSRDGQGLSSAGLYHTSKIGLKNLLRVLFCNITTISKKLVCMYLSWKNLTNSKNPKSISN